MKHFLLSLLCSTDLSLKWIRMMETSRQKPVQQQLQSDSVRGPPMTVSLMFPAD